MTVDTDARIYEENYIPLLRQIYYPFHIGISFISN